MLLNLPSEVILEILRYLTLKTKLNLITTCRRLKELVSNITLYECLDIRCHDRDAEAIIMRFKNKEFNGSQVRTLEAYIQELPRELMLQLLEIFPNVTNVISYHDQDIEDYERMSYFREREDEGIMDLDVNEYVIEYERTEKRFVENPECNWIKSVQTFKTWDHWKAIWNMLKLHTFSRLVELNIWQFGYFQDLKIRFDDKNEEFDGSYFVPYFENAPSLKKLTLKGWTINLKL